MILGELQLVTTYLKAVEVITYLEVPFSELIKNYLIHTTIKLKGLLW